MNKYGVNITLRDLYYEVWADNQEIAMQHAFDLAYDDLGPVLWDLDPDCNECVTLEGEDEEDGDL